MCIYFEILMGTVSEDKLDLIYLGLISLSTHSEGYVKAGILKGSDSHMLVTVLHCQLPGIKKHLPTFPHIFRSTVPTPDLR